MTVKLCNTAEAYVQELMRDGSCGNAEQVVDLLILKQRADDRHDAAFPPLEPEQLEAELLPGEFRKLAERLITEQAGQ